MPCVKVRSLAGREREICDGKLMPLKREYITPQVAQETHSLFSELEKEIGVGFGDAVKILATPIARLAGRTDCSSCEGRRLTWNAGGELIKKHGFRKAVGIAKELFTITDKEEVASRLKDYLDGA